MEIMETSLTTPSHENSSDQTSDGFTSDDGFISDDEGASDEDTSDEDLFWNSDDIEDALLLETSSIDDSTLSDDKLSTTDSTDTDAEGSTLLTSFPTQVFNDLKLMYAHRYEEPRQKIPKPPQSFLKHVLETLKTSRPDYFRTELRVSPLAFDRLVQAIANDPVFENHTKLSCQAPIKVQLAVALYRFGHNGNAASLQSVANWAGIGKGTVELYTHRVMTALLRPEFMGESVRWPNDEEKEAAKRWVQLHSCKAWRNGWCFVDGTLIPLANRPYWYGESYFDRKCRYSLNVQVRYHCVPSDVMISLTNVNYTDRLAP